VRCVIWNVLDLRDQFKDVTIVYGARSVGDLVYKRELEEWGTRADVKLWQTVDPGGQTPEWKGEVGFVPAIVEKAAPKADDAYAVVCGPPVMIKFTLPVLARLGFAEDRIYTTLENRISAGWASAAAATSGRCTCARTGRCSRRRSSSSCRRSSSLALPSPRSRPPGLPASAAWAARRGLLLLTGSRSASKSTGLEKWRSKPASIALRRSEGWPVPGQGDEHGVRAPGASRAARAPPVARPAALQPDVVDHHVRALLQRGRESPGAAVDHRPGAPSRG
jgi:hypothetical protein